MLTGNSFAREINSASGAGVNRLLIRFQNQLNTDEKTDITIRTERLRRLRRHLGLSGRITKEHELKKSSSFTRLASTPAGLDAR